MKRDPRLHGLSSDHHHALRLAWGLHRAAAAGTLDEGWRERARSQFERELAPHFLVEETVLLTALEAAGEHALAERTRREHAQLRDALASADAGDLQALGTFADRLEAHVRFEESELFPACEARLSDEVLEEALRRAPKEGRRFSQKRARSLPITTLPW